MPASSTFRLLVLSLAIIGTTAYSSPTAAPTQSPAEAPVNADPLSPTQSPAEAPVNADPSSPTQSPSGAPEQVYNTLVYGRVGRPGVDLISETCALAKTHEELCVEALSAEPPSRRATKQQLASIALRLASRNATENVGYIIGLADQSDAEPNMQQCLTDCTDQYQDAIEQVKDALSALDDGGYNDAITWIQAGMSDVKACQDGCKEVAEHKNVLTKRNANFNRLCSISISIIRTLI